MEDSKKATKALPIIEAKNWSVKYRGQTDTHCLITIYCREKVEQDWCKINLRIPKDKLGRV